MGLGHLLDIACEVLPRNLISFIISKFNHRTRTLILPNGLSVVITPFMIHQAIGTPVGGMQIGERPDEQLRELIAGMIKCKGRFPTITEIDNFITTQLEGVSFKIAFGMYAITAFLCPSSNGAICPEYIHIFREPEKIGLFDMSAAVLDKLVSSIGAYNSGTTCVLGGNFLSMVIVYLELLQADVMPSHLKFKLPRVSLWTTQMVTDIESMDCVSFGSVQYGKLPVKPLSDTIFSPAGMVSVIGASKSYGDLLQFMLSIFPEQQHKRVIDELPIIIENMQRDIVHTIQPIFFQNIINVMNLLPSFDSVAQNAICRRFETEEAHFKVPLSELEFQKEDAQQKLDVSDDGTLNIHRMEPKASGMVSVGQCNAEHAAGDVTMLEAKLNEPCKVSELVLQKEDAQQKLDVSDDGTINIHCMEPKSCGMDAVGQCSAEHAAGEVTMMEAYLTEPCTDAVKQHSSNESDGKGKPIDFFFLPVPVFDDEQCSFFNMRSMSAAIESMPLPDLFDIPYPQHLLEEMLPQKVEISSEYLSTPPVLDLLSYMLEEAVAESKLWNLMTEKVCTVDEKVEVYNELFTSTTAGSSFNENKRVFSTSTNDVTVSCVALKKRAMMLEFKSELHLSPPTTEIAVVSTHEVGQQQRYITYKTSLGSNDKHVSKGFSDCGRSDFQASPPSAGDGSAYRHNDAPPTGYVSVGGTQYRLADPNEPSFNWDDESVEKDLYELTIQAEEEYKERKKRNYQPARPARNNVCLSEVSQSLNYQPAPPAQNNARVSQISPALNYQPAPPAQNNVRLSQISPSLNYQSAPPAQNNVRLSEISPSTIASSYVSSLVEKEVFSDIVSRIPKTARAKTVHVVCIGSTWAEHRVFGLSMMVYGKVSPYVMNTLGKAVMAEDSERKKFNLLKHGHWKRFYIEFNVAALFQMDHENPGKLSTYLSNRNIGFMLDTMDLVHLPLFTSGFYYLVVVNFKKHVFQVLHPNRKIHLIKDEADIAVKKFKMAFKIAYKHSGTNIDDMQTVFQSVCSTERDGDSGVFVMKMICDYNAEKTFLFEPEHAKPIREMLTYYMLAHPSNEKMPHETKKILDRYGIAYDYKPPGYTPWKSQETEDSSQDSIERMLIF